MSSNYTVQISRANPLTTVSISRWKVEGALHKPNGMTTNSYKPEWVANQSIQLILEPFSLASIQILDPMLKSIMNVKVCLWNHQS